MPLKDPPMKIASLLLLCTVLPVATLAAQLPAYGEDAAPMVVAQGEDAVAAAQKSLEAAEKALANAEETGGDIRAARRSLANAMKSLRAAETATGTPPAAATPPAADPAPRTVRPAQANPVPAQPATPAPVAPPAAAAPPAQPAQPAPPQAEPSPPPAATPAPPAAAGPKPYQPPTANPPAAAPRPAKPPAEAPKPKANTAPSSSTPRGSEVIRRSGGQTETRTRQPGGITIIDITDRANRLVRRIQIAPDGSETVLYDRDRPVVAPVEQPRIYDPREVPPPPGAYGPRGGLDGGNASEAEIEGALRARPNGPGMGGYSLNEIRRSERLRARVAAVDLDTITFESGSARVPPDEIWKLERIATAIGNILARWPDQVFLIEGHTDAIGTRLANQELSDRRAASVAAILYRSFGIPGENLVTQGYGEDYPKVLTEGPSRENRRVTIRNITPLLGR